MSTDDRTLGDLRAAALFTRLDEGQLERLAGVAQPRRLAADETLFLQGDEATAFFLLAEGRLKVFKLLRDGRTATVRHVEPGQTFAEAALFHEVYPSSTETLTECLVYRFDKEQTLALLLAEPQLAVNLLAAMAHLLGLLNRRVEELLLPVPARLARYLLARADEQLEPRARRRRRDALATCRASSGCRSASASWRRVWAPCRRRSAARSTASSARRSSA